MIVEIGTNSSFKARWQSCDLPAPTIVTADAKPGGSGWVRVGPGEFMNTAKENKPPYYVHSMEEIATIPWNGFNVASTFSGAGGSCLGYRMAGFKVRWANEFVPAAQDSYKANAGPDCILDCRDIRQVRPEEILATCGLKQGELDLFDGSPPCFATGTPVTTARGVVPVENVVPGDMVLTHLHRWRRVIRCMSRVAPTVWVDGRIETTADHPFWCREAGRIWSNDIRQYRRTLGIPAWTQAANVGGLFAASPRHVEPLEMPPAPAGFRYDDAFWYAVGRWVGDGWLRIVPGDPVQTIADRPKQSPSPVPCRKCGRPSELNRRITGVYTNYCSRTCAVHHKQQRRRLPRHEVLVCTSKPDADSLRQLLAGLGVAVGEAEQRTSIRFTISRKSLALWLCRWFGRGAAGKTLPGWTLGMKQSWRAALLAGYRDADGDSPTTVSRCLAVAAALLAGTLGYTVSVSKPYQNRNNNIEGRTVNVLPQYVIGITADDGRYTVVEGTTRWRKIRKATVPAAVTATVYDFEVEEDHSFTVDLYAVHNCQSFSTAGKRQKGWGKAKTYEHGAKQCNETLFTEYIRILRGLMPRVFIAENVSGLVKGVAKGYFLEILRDLKASGYRVGCKVLDAQWLGVPQCRKRVIFIGVREDLGIEPAHPKPLPYRYSVRDALPWIGKLIHDTGGQKPNRFAANVDVTAGQGPAVTNGVNALSSYHFKVESLPPSRLKAGAYGVQDVRPDEPCPTVTIGSPGNDLAVQDWQEKPMATVQAGAGARASTGFTHGSCKVPGERRKFTIAELKRICAFPDDFILTGNYAQQWERLGNSVPPVMMFWIASTVRDKILAIAKGEVDGRSSDS